LHHLSIGTQFNVGGFRITSAGPALIDRAIFAPEDMALPFGAGLQRPLNSSEQRCEWTH
jgi:hypothetical protein